jgi:CheY-like chemotaxis protein
LPKRHCLIVEDDLDDQDFFKVAIASLPYQIDCKWVNNGVEALEYFENHPDFEPEFIFIDFQMPKMDGLECFKRLKEFPQTQKSKIFLFSSLDKVERDEENRSTYHLIQKPNSIQEIIQLLNSIFEKNFIISS